VQYNSNHAEWTLDAASNVHGEVAARASGRGSLGLFSGVPFASRPVGHSSFAVVEVPGVAGVPVKLSHQVVAVTDARGRAFVPGLMPWQKNQIEIDPAELPLDTDVGNLVQQVTPYAASGALVKFAVRRTRQALVVLHRGDGQPVPIGARVRLLPDGPQFIVGRRGQVWLTDLAAERQHLQVSWADGGCTLDMAVPAANGGMPAKLGPLICAR
jgi:outer membrane usher protein